MSFGEPNNPYGPPQPAPQQPPAPGYGYPGQPPQQGYGAPQAPGYGQQPYPQYPGDPGFQGGYPGGPVGPFAMPSLARAAQIMLGIVVFAHVIVAGGYAYVLSVWDKEMDKAGVSGNADAEKVADLGKGVIVFLVGLAAVFAILGLILLLQWTKGGNGVRVCAIVYGSFAIVTGIFMIAAWGLGIVLMVVSILLIVFSAKRVTAEWFRRPRY
ncbi:proline-rich domain-containing protein [Streptomyces phaeofaciens]|uniref:proline-rich domain-containing protein n=1 Tax=Streptomyces phaeofaciens TaxID=68254 RepID=UPI003678BB4B